MNMKLKGYTKGSLETRVAGAKDLEKKSLYLSKAQAIVDSLRYSLDDSAGAEAVGNLRELYMYMSTRIADASIELDVDIIDEVARLMIDIKGAWDQIPVEQRDVAMNQMQQAAGA